MTQYVDMGPWPVYVGYCNNAEAFQRELKRLKVTDDVPFVSDGMSVGATMHTFARPGHNIVCIITLKAKRHTREQIAALIAHEALHIVQEMRDELNKGQPFDRESEAYLIQHIVQHCLNTERKRAVRPV